MVKPAGIVTLLTDFGLEDPFVGMMKGVILSRFPDARIVDLSHGVAPQDITAAAFWLQRSYGWFPMGTVHVAVVDPGVGTARAAVVGAANGHLFVAPDNGVITGVIASDPNAEVYAIRQRFSLPPPGPTFHGRDVFAPTAADLASGRTSLAEVGDKTELTVAAAYEPAVLTKERVEGIVVLRDHFGNLITNIDAPLLGALVAPVVEVSSVQVPVMPMGASYASVSEGEVVALVNSHGTLEIAVRNGNAAERLGIGPGASVCVK